MKIIKEPNIQFKYNKDISEEKAIEYAEIVRLLASFYFQTSIDYTLSRIHLKENTILIKKVSRKNLINNSGNFWDFKNFWSFVEFMQSNWQKGALDNYKKLSKAIEMFIQSIIAGCSSSFLIRYNIIEICKGGSKADGERFVPIISKKEVTKKCNEALNILLQALDPKDYMDFKTMWQSVRSNLSYRPMEIPLLSFLENQGLNLSLFPIPVKRLKEIRNSITHGSTDIDPNELEKANILLYRITGILILNLLGVKEWKLDIDLK